MKKILFLLTFFALFNFLLLSFAGPAQAGDHIDWLFRSNNASKITWEVAFNYYSLAGTRNEKYHSYIYYTVVNSTYCTGWNRCRGSTLDVSGGAPYDLHWGTACIDPRINAAQYDDPTSTISEKYYEATVNVTANASNSNGVFTSLSEQLYPGGTPQWTGWSDQSNCPHYECKPGDTQSAYCGTGSSRCNLYKRVCNNKGQWVTTLIDSDSTRCLGVDGCCLTNDNCGSSYCGSGGSRCDYIDRYCNSNQVCSTRVANADANRCIGVDGCCLSNSDCGSNQFCNNSQVCDTYNQLGGRVYDDRNANGNFNSSVDKPIPGKVVERKTSASLWSGTTETDTTGGNGRYLFTKLQNASQDVRTWLGQYDRTCLYVDNVWPSSPITNITTTPSLNSVDFSFRIRNYSIGGVVWEDTDGDGNFSSGDTRYRRSNVIVRTNEAGTSNFVGNDTIYTGSDSTRWGRYVIVSSGGAGNLRYHASGEKYDIILNRSTLASGWDVIRSENSLNNKISGITVNCGNTGGHHFLVSNNPPPAKPDLSIDSFTIPDGNAGSAVNATVTIINEGNTTTGTNNFTIRVRNSITGGQTFSVDTTPLGDGARRTISVPITLPSTGGIYTADVFVDSTDVVAESDETNNTATTTYEASAVLYSISGGVYEDPNRSGTLETALGESYASGTISVSGGTLVGTSTFSSTGSLPNLGEGIYRVSFTPPAGYYGTYPAGLNPPPPTVNIGLGSLCPTASTTHTGVVCVNGNATLVDFGYAIVPPGPWFAGFGGDMRSDPPLNNVIPDTASYYFSNFDATVNAIKSGVIFGKSIVLKQLSTSPLKASDPDNWLVENSFQGTIKTSYRSIEDNLRKNGGLDTATSLFPASGGICNLATSTCDFSSVPASGIYTSDRNMTIQGSPTVPAGTKLLFLINGDLTINSNITVNKGGTAVFVVNGNINVARDVTSIQGVFSAGNDVNVEGGSAPDPRLLVGGSIIVNTNRSGGDFIRGRDLLDAGNETTPAIEITYRPDFILNMPDYIKFANYTIHEVAPGSSSFSDFVPTPTPKLTNTPTPKINTPTPTPKLTNTPTPTPLPTNTPTPAPVVIGTTLTAWHDAFVRSDNPNTNYGSGIRLKINGTPKVITYIKFNTTSVIGKTIKSATLRIHVSPDTGSGSSATYNIKKVSDSTWGEGTITYNNRPGLPSTVLKQFVGRGLNQDIDIDITGSVDNTKTLNTWAIARDGTNDEFILNSKDANSYPPKLIIYYYQ